MSVTLCDWPALPPRPTRGQATVIRLSHAAPRSALRGLAREAVLRLAQTWGHAEARLVEHADGPRLVGCGELALSLAYSADQAWIALTEGPAIGIDATDIRGFEGMDDVARLYLAPAAASGSPASFAEAWSRHEATLKYHRRPLTEWRAPIPAPPREHTMQAAGCAVSVAFG